MYNGQFIKALVHVLVFVVLIGITDEHGIFGLFIAAWVLYQVFDANQTAKARRDGLPLPDPFGLNELGHRLGIQHPNAPAAAPYAAPGQPYPGSGQPYAASQPYAAAGQPYAAGGQPYATGQPYPQRASPMHAATAAESGHVFDRGSHGS